MESPAKIGDQIVLYNDSDPVVYDPDGAWTFDAQTTVQQADGTMKTETQLDRPLGATPLLSSNIILPDGLCKEAFLDSKGNCVAVQLSALLKMPLQRVEHEIDMLYNTVSKSQYIVDNQLLDWRDAGVSSCIIN